MNTLPTELLEHVFRYTSTSDGTDSHQSVKTLASLCMASRWLCNAAQPLLYKSIELNIDSKQPQLLLNSLRTKPKLAATVRELFLRMTTKRPTPWNVINMIRQFLADILPLLTHLLILRSNHRLCTTRLIESILYKQGDGYCMSAPRDLHNLRTLELFAADYVFNYNSILRLPQLQSLYLRNLDVTDPLREDGALPDDWGWSSQSIKELVLQLDDRPSDRGFSRLRWNSLQALARSVPHLESLRIEQVRPFLDPCLCRALTWVFVVQHKNLLRLEIQNGRIIGRPALNGNPFSANDLTRVEEIRASKLEYLSIDWHTLVPQDFDKPLSGQTLPILCPLERLRHLRFRYVEFSIWRLPAPHPASLLECINVSFPSLEKLDLELELQEPVEEELLERYITAFASAGIVLRIL